MWWLPRVQTLTEHLTAIVRECERAAQHRILDQQEQERREIIMKEQKERELQETQQKHRIHFRLLLRADSEWVKLKEDARRFSKQDEQLPRRMQWRLATAEAKLLAITQKLLLLQCKINQLQDQVDKGCILFLKNKTLNPLVIPKGWKVTISRRERPGLPKYMFKENNRIQFNHPLSKDGYDNNDTQGA
jgi:hypothetical protein